MQVSIAPSFLYIPELLSGLLQLFTSSSDGGFWSLSLAWQVVVVWPEDIRSHLEYQ